MTFPASDVANPHWSIGYIENGKVALALRTVRKSFLVITKGHILELYLFCLYHRCNSHAPEDVLPACQETMKRLQLDYLDLYLVKGLTYKIDVRLMHYTMIVANICFLVG